MEHSLDGFNLGLQWIQSGRYDQHDAGASDTKNAALVSVMDYREDAHDDSSSTGMVNNAYVAISMKNMDACYILPDQIHSRRGDSIADSLSVCVVDSTSQHFLEGYCGTVLHSGEDRNPQSTVATIQMRFRPNEQAANQIIQHSLNDGLANNHEDNHSSNHGVMAESSWFDEVLLRWTPSGCTTSPLITSFDHSEHHIDCWCSHMTEFSVLMYELGEADENRDDETATDAQYRLQYNAVRSRDIGLQLYVCLALMFFALGNSIYSSITITKANISVRFKNARAMLNTTVFNALLMLAVVVHTLYSLDQVLFGHELTAILSHHWPRLWIAVPPILISLRFSLYSLFTMLIMTPLLRHPANQYGHRYTKLFAQIHRNTAIIFLGVMTVVAFLIVYDESLKIVSVLIGILSFLIAIVYTSVAYRCYALIIRVSRGTSIQSSTASYAHIARFTMIVSAMYGTGHVFQSGMYLGSVFWPQPYSHNFHLFQLLFKWADMLTLTASLAYVHRSVKTIKRRQYPQANL